MGEETTRLIVVALAVGAVLAWPLEARRRMIRPLFASRRGVSSRRTASTGRNVSSPPTASTRGPASSRLEWPPGRGALRALVWGRNHLPRLIRIWRRDSSLGAGELLPLVDALAPALAAGLGPSRAWELAALATCAGGDPRVVEIARVAAESAAAGAPVGPVLTESARTHRSRPLLLLGTAWRLSERTGAPLAPMTATVAGMLRADQSASRRLEAVSTESRTTARILTALPLAGPLLAAALGVDLRRVAAAGVWVWVAVGVGLALAAIGRIWLRRLAERVVRGPRVR